MTQLFALKLTVTNRLGTFVGLVTDPSEDYDATCAWRDDMMMSSRQYGFKAITLVDGQNMIMIPEALAQESVINFEVVDRTP